MTKVQAFLYKIFEEINNYICLWKRRLQQLRKTKYSILAWTLHIFQNIFLTESHTYLYNALCKSHDFLICCFESWHIFEKMRIFWKITFVILFQIRSSHNKVARTEQIFLCNEILFAAFVYIPLLWHLCWYWFY